jgi:hypothetical protein
MKSFNQYLTEGIYDQYLYHGTTIYSALSIIFEDKFASTTLQKVTKYHSGEEDGIKRHHPNAMLQDLRNGVRATHYYGVSFTRSFKFAERWSNTYDDMNVVFKIDRRILAQHNKILPISFFKSREPGRHHQDELEEFVIGPVKGVRRMTAEIIVFSPAAKHKIIDLTEVAKQPKYNIRVQSRTQ